MTDSNSSTKRSFFCRDVLWQMFSRIANDNRCTVDFLINEAMITYLKEKRYDTSFLNPQSAPAQRAPAPYSQAAYGQRVNYPPLETAPPAQAFASTQAPKAPPPAPPAYRRPPSIYEEPNAPPASPAQPIVLASLEENRQARTYEAPMHDVRRMPPNQAYAADSRMRAEAVRPVGAQQIVGMRPLYLLFDNKRYTIDKDKYIIGRSSQLADLAIRDGNISRKHCAVIYKNGAHYIKDLDSTNGIEYLGNRIDSKKIEDGDRFNICEYQFIFSYKP
ncbi:MAG: FHA domain-containing protein [Bradymonadia bacterium]|jgi:hypothetical protein